MPVFEGSAKDYAASLGLAKPGKGRMSAAAHEAVEKARADGMTFSKENVAPKPPKQVSTEPAKPAKVSVPKGEYDPKEVRKWAKVNGVEVGDRGRVDSDIVRQYLVAMKEDGEKVPERKPTAEKDIRPEAPRVVPVNSKWRGVVNGKDVTVTNDRIACQRGRYSISHCGCPGGNHLVSLGGTSSVEISLVR